MLKKIAFFLGILIFVPQPVYAIDYMSSSAGNMNPVKAAIQNIKSGKQEVMAARESFHEQLSLIKDARKKTIAQRVNTGITNANKNRTNMMSAALDRFTNIISELSSKSATLKTQGKDTTALDAAITNAQTAITTATGMVGTQKAKTYSAEITDDSTLGNAIRQMVLQFKTDITATYQSVLTAKKAVVAAMLEMVKLTSSTETKATVVNQ